MKRMKHPQHGWHHAYDPHEEARMRVNGWVDDVPEVAPIIVEPEPAEAPQVKRKPGRPKKQ